MAAPSPLAGQTLGRYTIIEQIGAGGMGVVYRAHDTRLDRDVALKTISPGLFTNDAQRKHFRKEALTLSKLNHPNIATVHDFDTQCGLDFLVMEYVSGATLAAKRGPLPEKEIFALSLQIVEALQHAHQLGIVHRDLKPQNIMVTATGQVKLLDFGIARLLHTSDSATTESLFDSRGVGTLPYMAPDQLLGEEPDIRTDVYALGAVLYEMATGQRAFEGKLSTALADQIIHKPPRPPCRINSHLSPRLEELILKCMEKDPDRRYQSAKELSVDLRRTASLESPPTLDARFKQARPLVKSLTIAILLVAALAMFEVYGWRGRLLHRGVISIHSLAVLPLEDLSHSPEQDYFAEGITEELITELSKIKSLRVISRTSAMHYKGTTKTLPEVARELHVDAVVEGSVLRVGNRVRITAELIEGRTDKHLWAQTYDRDMQDILALQSSVAQAVVQAIRVTLTPEEKGRLERTLQVDPQAHEAYLKGRYYWNKRTPESVQKGLKYFQEAIERDPRYAPAYAGLADSYDLLGSYRTIQPRNAFRMAKEAAGKALQIDDELAEAYASLAATKFFYLEWNGVDENFRRAIELDPGYSTARHWYALYLAATGRNEEALVQIKLAQQLDPLSLIINANLAWCLYLGRDYDGAVKQSQVTLELDPNFPVAHEYLGQAYLEKGAYADAISELQKAFQLSRNDASIESELGNAYATMGRKQEARRVLDDLLQRLQHGNASPYDIAMIYIGLGDHEKSLYWLNRAADEGSTGLVNLGVHPRFDRLRKDGRFETLLQRLGMARKPDNTTGLSHSRPDLQFSPRRPLAGILPPLHRWETP